MAKRVINLCYHRINNLEIDINRLAVSTHNFRNHLEWIKDNYIILKSEDDWNEISQDGVVVTFDDGYEDFYTKAFPILKELNIPATVFITIGKNASNRMMWWDELEHILFEGYVPYIIRISDEIINYKWVIENIDDKNKCYQEIHYLMKNIISSKRREEWLDQLWQAKGEERNLIERYRMLNDEQISELAKSDLITIGAHTMTHSALKNRDINEREFEIGQSIEKLKSICGKEIEVFSYPFGYLDKDYSIEDNQICNKYNIKKTFSTNAGSWKKKDGNFNIKRNGVNNKTISDFVDYIEEIERI